MLMEEIIKEEQQEVKEDKEEKVGSKKATKAKEKGKKEVFTTTITKNKDIEKAIKGFIPEGIRIFSDKRPSED